jgi:hypothetical protein
VEHTHQLIFKKRHIIGEARKFIEYILLHRNDTVQKIANELKDRYNEDLTEKDLRIKLNCMKMKEDDKLRSWAGRVKTAFC